MKNVIYKIVNLVNDKFYVGSTTNQKERFRAHRKQLRKNRHHCPHLQSAWNKYGEEKFDFRVVEEVPTSESLQAVEDRWLKEHVGKPYCYNAGYTSNAPWRNAPKEKHPRFGTVRPAEEREAISKTLKAYYAANYYNHPRVGKFHSDETKAKISATKKANPSTYWLGRAHSEETKRKLSEAQKGKPKAPGRRVSEEGMAKIRAAAAAGHYAGFKGRKHTEEAKDKLRKTVFVTPDSLLFASLTDVLQYYSLSMPTLRNALKSGKPISRGRLVGYSFSYGGIGVKQPEEDKALIDKKLRPGV